MQLGEAIGVVVKFIHDCYPASVDNTILENTVLEIEEIPTVEKCRKCNFTFRPKNLCCCTECESTYADFIDRTQFMIKDIIAR